MQISVWTQTINIYTHSVLIVILTRCDSGYDLMMGSCEHCNEHFGPIKSKKFLYLLLLKDCTTWCLVS